MSVLEAADQAGMVVILGCFYGRQTPHLKDEAAVKRAVGAVVDLLAARGVSNALIEIGNEVDLPWFEHDIIQAPRGHELIELVRARSNGRLKVSTSFSGGAVPSDNVIAAADYLLVHGNHVRSPRASAAWWPTPAPARLSRPADRLQRGRPLRLRGQGQQFPLRARRLCQLGLLRLSAHFRAFSDGYQSLPVDWGINSLRKRAFFGYLKEVTGS